MTCVAKPDQPDSSALHGRIPPEIMAGMELQTHSLQAGCLNEIDAHFGRLVRSRLLLFEQDTYALDSLLDVGSLLSSDEILSLKQARALQIH